LNNSPILYVGGDDDDRYLVTDALSDIGFQGQVINFDDGDDLIEYLSSSQDRPFIILSDLHLPKMSGLELKETINADDKLKRRAIPFIFLSESVNPRDVDEAYMSLVQGFYIKAKTYEKLKEQMAAICNYWEKATLPGEGERAERIDAN
jgi:CheY-like chemotaxis protein